jgi:ABC-type lipoprotein export system ATPase subunit
VHEPQFIVADEPTGNLDSMTGRDITQLLCDITHTTKIGMLIATHDISVVNVADRVLSINDGLISEE